MRAGPAFVKIGKAILYPVDELYAWEKTNMGVVPCVSTTDRYQV
jgi:hypothetical protein